MRVLVLMGLVSFSTNHSARSELPSIPTMLSLTHASIPLLHVYTVQKIKQYSEGIVHECTMCEGVNEVNRLV